MGDFGKVSFGSCTVEPGLPLSETLGRAMGCAPGLRVAASEGERAPIGFGGGGGGGGGVGRNGGGGGGGICGCADALRDISGGG